MPAASAATPTPVGSTDTVVWGSLGIGRDSLRLGVRSVKFGSGEGERHPRNG